MSTMTDRIADLCNRKKISISKLERGIGASNGTVRLWFERGSMPKIDTLIAVADYLETTVAYLIGETDSVERGKLVMENETHVWDYLVPLTVDECQWIAAKRFVESHADHPLDEEQLEKLTSAELEKR